jgi:hypothetical protein
MSYQNFLASLREPALVAVTEYWNTIRSGRLLPSWQSLDPAALRKHLPIVWAWRWEPALGTFLGRLSGEDIVAVHGQGVRGKRIEEVFSREAAEIILARYKRVIDGPTLMHGYGKVFVLSGGHGQGERIVLPLAADGSRADGVFGATVYRRGERRINPGEATLNVAEEVVNFFDLT